MDKKTNLRDAFEKAFKNERFTINGSEETNLSDASKSTLSNKNFDYEKIIFLSEGKSVCENFRKNDPVSSLNNNSNSPISIIVRFPISTQIISKTKYNYCQ